MTSTNRNRKLSLDAGWQYYWFVLFPEGIDWRSDLETEIRQHLYSPGDYKVFQKAGHLEGEPPAWAANLELQVQKASVTVTFSNVEIGKFPLFLDQLIPVLSNWNGRNPFDKTAAQSDLTDKEQRECRDLVHAVVLNCCKEIQNRFLRHLTESEQPAFDIYCKPNGDVFADEKKLPPEGLKDFDRIDINRNELKNRLGLAVYSYVQIQLRKPSQSKAGPRGSFHEQDAELINEMKSLIDENRQPNVAQAALAVLAKAPRRRNSCEESVLRRLQSKFSQKYPSYSNRSFKTDNST